MYENILISKRYPEKKCMKVGDTISFKITFQIVPSTMFLCSKPKVLDKVHISDLQKGNFNQMSNMVLILSTLSFRMFFYCLTTHKHNNKYILVLVHITHNKCIFLHRIGGLWLMRQKSEMIYVQSARTKRKRVNSNGIFLSNVKYDTYSISFFLRRFLKMVN